MSLVQKAMVMTACGPPSVLKLMPGFAVPPRQKGEVMVHVKSTSVNRVDTLIRRGIMAPPQLPKVLGGELAGIVCEAEATSKFKVGDKVFAFTDSFLPFKPYGTYAEYFPVQEDLLVHVPDNLPLDVAGGAPLVALTAWQALNPSSLKPGTRTLVLGAAGAVGHFAVQFAKAFGAYVVVRVGASNVEFAKELGADEVFDYRKSSMEETAAKGKFDLVLDTVGGEEGKAGYKVLKADGEFSHVMSYSLSDEYLKEISEVGQAGNGPRVRTTVVSPNGQDLQQIADLIAAGKVKLTVHKKFPLEEAAEAHEYSENTRGTRGKAVVLVV